MKRLLLVVIIVAVIGIVCSSGCTSPQATTTPQTGSSGTQQVTTISTTAPVGVTMTTESAGRVIIDTTFNIQSGYQTTYQKYAFEDYGFVYLYPKDSFSISINSDKPVNVLVIDKADELKFPTVEPLWNTDLRKDQWDYSPVVPVFSQSNVLKKDMTFTIKDKSSYFLIIDPRFASDQAGWHGAKHEEVHIDVKVTKN